MRCMKKSPTTAKKAKVKATIKRGRVRKDSIPARIVSRGKQSWQKLKRKTEGFLKRRPHRSFRRTRRRDYARSLKLPGYFAFSNYVSRTLVKNKKIFIGLVVFYSVMVFVVGGFVNQETYSEVSNLMKESSQTLFDGGINKVGQAGLLLLATVTNGNQSLGSDQQIILALLLFMVWLTSVWLLREQLQGRNPKLRDGLYSAGSPIVATLIVALVILIQLLPLGLAGLVYVALSTIGLLSEGFGAMIFWVTVALVATMVLYWITSSLIALVVVTLPGMYPFRALKISGDLVIGRRLRIMYRWLWAVLNIVVVWTIVMVPIILLDGWLKGIWSQIEWMPIIPIAVSVMSSLTVVWFSSYVYLLYRKVVDDDAKPAIS